MIMNTSKQQNGCEPLLRLMSEHLEDHDPFPLILSLK